jgi:hypothetical protein
VIDTFHDIDGLRPLAALIKPNGWLVSPKARGIDEAFQDLPVTAASVAAALGRVGELADLAAAGTLSIPVTTVSLDDGNTALDQIRSAGVRGKLTIDVSQDRAAA